MFPNNARGAVSFTYDDGIDVHLDHAMPDLEAAGLVGTFYVPTGHPPEHGWHRRRGDWVGAARRGHEIANHTRHHPCTRAFPWVKIGFANEDYDLARIERELTDASSDIRAATGGNAPHSFAYACCHDWVGPEHTSFRPVCERLFPASRGGSQRELADPRNLDFTFVPSWMLSIIHGTRSIDDFLRQAIDEGKWAVLMFHGVGGGHGINLSRETHQHVCRRVAELRPQLHCDTFVNVAMHLRHALNKPWPA